MHSTRLRRREEIGWMVGNTQSLETRNQWDHPQRTRLCRPVLQKWKVNFLKKVYLLVLGFPDQALILFYIWFHFLHRFIVGAEPLKCDESSSQVMKRKSYFVTNLCCYHTDVHNCSNVELSFNFMIDFCQGFRKSQIHGSIEEEKGGDEERDTKSKNNFVWWSWYYISLFSLFFMKQHNVLLRSNCHIFSVNMKFYLLSRHSDTTATAHKEAEISPPQIYIIKLIYLY